MHHPSKRIKTNHHFIPKYDYPSPSSPQGKENNQWSFLKQKQRQPYQPSIVALPETKPHLHSVSPMTVEMSMSSESSTLFSQTMFTVGEAVKCVYGLGVVRGIRNDGIFIIELVHTKTVAYMRGDAVAKLFD